MPDSLSVTVAGVSTRHVLKIAGWLKAIVKQLLFLLNLDVFLPPFIYLCLTMTYYAITLINDVWLLY